MSSFSDFTVEEVKHCAFLYSTMELDYDKEHFQELSVRFLSGALVSYRKKRNSALAKVQKEREQSERDEANKDVRDKPIPATYILMRSKIGSAYNKALENKKKVNIDENYAGVTFQYLALKGVLITSKESLSEYRQLGYESLRKSFKSNERFENAFEKMQLKKEIYDSEELRFKKLIQKRSAKMLLDDWLTEKTENGKLFKDFFLDFKED